jgi:ring-1,2-phenylacetyl-CoA epoxidase subunit PaaE
MVTDFFIKRLRLVNIMFETEHARSFTLEPLDGWKPVYNAGQFLTLIFTTPFGEKRRSFSITSSMALNEPLSITVKKVDNGEFSRPLVYTAQIGDIFYSSGISGMFTLPEDDWPERFCFLAAGSGITPCYALIKTILTISNKQVILFYSNRNASDAIFYKQLQLLKERYPEQFHVHFLFSDSSDIYHKRLSKWLLDQLLDQYLPGTANTLYYLCGPFDYMQTAEITLLTRSDRNHIIKESFSSLPRLTLPEPPDRLPHKVTLQIAQTSHTLDVQYPTSILKAALANGIELPYSCEAGRCGACVASCVSGHIWMAYNEVLTDGDIQKGRILTCQGFPVGGDVKINFPE